MCLFLQRSPSSTRTTRPAGRSSWTLTPPSQSCLPSFVSGFLRCSTRLTSLAMRWDYANTNKLKHCRPNCVCISLLCSICSHSFWESENDIVLSCAEHHSLTWRLIQLNHLSNYCKHWLLFQLMSRAKKKKPMLKLKVIRYTVGLQFSFVGQTSIQLLSPALIVLAWSLNPDSIVIVTLTQIQPSNTHSSGTLVLKMKNKVWILLYVQNRITRVMRHNSTSYWIMGNMEQALLPLCTSCSYSNADTLSTRHCSRNTCILNVNVPRFILFKAWMMLQS